LPTVPLGRADPDQADVAAALAFGAITATLDRTAVGLTEHLSLEPRTRRGDKKTERWVKT
jgi:hypothetical protein